MWNVSVEMITRFNLTERVPKPAPEQPIPNLKRLFPTSKMKQYRHDYYHDYYLTHKEHMRETHHLWYLRQRGEK